jgi:hypothetical protein
MTVVPAFVGDCGPTNYPCGLPHHREEYSSFWWKGNGGGTLIRRYWGEEGMLTFNVSGTGTLSIGVQHGFDGLGNLQGGSCGRNAEGFHYCSANANVNPGAVLTPGVWHRVELYLRASNLRDGIIRLWVDGNLVINETATDLSAQWMNGPYGIGTIGSWDDVRISKPRATAPPAMVTYLRPITATATSVLFAWGAAEDGTGKVADHSMRFAATPIGPGWGAATPVSWGTCATLTDLAYPRSSWCSVEGLSSGTSYDFQMVAYRDDSSGTSFGPLSVIATASTGPAAGVPGTILDLTAGSFFGGYQGPDWITLAFHEVDDGTGHPANYQVRYAPKSIGSSWGEAKVATLGTCASPMVGTWTGPASSPGTPRYCTVKGLQSGTTYDFQIVGFRGTLDVDAVFGGLSNVATGVTNSVPTPPPPPPIRSRKDRFGRQLEPSQ